MPRLLALLAVLALPVASASAATLSVTPAPANPNSACPSGDPCSFAHAIQVAASGDVIELAPGGYDLTVQKNLFGVSIRGRAGQARPQIVESNNAGLSLSNPAELRHVGVVQASSSGNTGVALSAGSSMEDVDVRCVNACSAVLSMSLAGTVRDAVLLGPSSNDGIEVTGTATLRNVTAIVGGNNSTGIAAFSNGNTTAVDARNVIARGAGVDLSTVTAGGSATITYGWSDVRAGSEFHNGGSTTDLGNDVREDPPKFADLANGDVHLRADSALIDAGTADTLGPADLDGDLRTLGAAPDIGADEAAIAPPLADSGEAASIGSTSATLSGTVTPDGRPTTWRFEWGTTLAYGQATADATAGNGNAAVPATTALSGLAPDTVYHYRLVAASAFGTTPGPDRVFRTLPAPAAPTPPAFGGVRSGTKRAKLDRQGRIAVRLSCPATAVTACTGTVRLLLPLATAAAKPAGARFSIPANAARTVRLRLTRSARRMVGRKGLRAQLLIAATDGAGRTMTTTPAILVRRR